VGLAGKFNKPSSYLNLQPQKIKFVQTPRMTHKQNSTKFKFNSATKTTRPHCPKFTVKQEPAPRPSFKENIIKYAFYFSTKEINA